MSRSNGSDPKRILAYGDWLTWGWIPVHVAPPSRRYPPEGRWPGVMQEALGTGYEVIEAGLNGRTADLPDPTLPQISGSGLDGSADLPATLATHLPLDLVLIMLGTNDLKAMFDRSPSVLLSVVPNLTRDRSQEITWYRNVGNRGPINLPVIF
jgi:lysophospholipase L1-like esterase